MSIAYPRSIGFIISNEFCERFNFYGMRTILVLYLTNKLNYNEETSTVLFHVFTMLVYLFPLIGAIVADSWLGKYKTILYLSCVYAVGCVVIAVGAVPLNFMPANAITIIGLILMAVGTGGIKPCVSAFGGDQFVLPKQARELAMFFSLFYFAINAGSLISTILTPILRADIHCFGENDCFSLAFGVPAILMVLSVLILICGKSLYRINPPAGNMIFGVTNCIAKAFSGWRANRNTQPRKHFLDYAEGKVAAKMLNDTRALLKILLLYLPFPVYWALMEQQGSRWTFQATRMDGHIFKYLAIKPDQMQVVNPLLVLCFIPLFDYIIYPLLSKIGIKRPLQRLTWGGLLAAFAFVLSALVELRLETMEPTGAVAAAAAATDHRSAQLRLYNGMPCRYYFTFSETETNDMITGILQPLNMWSSRPMHITETKLYSFLAHADMQTCIDSIGGMITLKPAQATAYFLANKKMHAFVDEMIKPKVDNSLLRILLNVPDYMDADMQLLHKDQQTPIHLNHHNQSQIISVNYGENGISVNGTKLIDFKAGAAGVYTLLVHGTKDAVYKAQVVEVLPPNKMSMLWQLPQIIVITAAEIMFSVTGLEFSFTQAPQTMKSVLQACWLLSIAMGNMLVVIIAEIRVFRRQSAEFLLFAALMLVDVALFVWLAERYTYVDNDLQQDEQEAQNGKMPKPVVMQAIEKAAETAEKPIQTSAN